MIVSNELININNKIFPLDTFRYHKDFILGRPHLPLYTACGILQNETKFNYENFNLHTITLAHFLELC
jgi:hypothetical protein